MIEKNIEEMVISRMRSKLDGLGIQVIGSWDCSYDLDIKSLEGGDKVGYLTIKTRPRGYETPTIPYCQIEMDLNLVVKSDADYGGSNYIATVEAISDQLQDWQSGFQQMHLDFGLDGFEPTGFQLVGGDIGVDRQNAVWEWSQQLICYGIVG